MKRDGENPMKMCKLTYESLLENDVSSSNFIKSTEFETSIVNPYGGIARPVLNALDCYRVYDRDITFCENRLFTKRRRLLDKLILENIEECK